MTALPSLRLGDNNLLDHIGRVLQSLHVQGLLAKPGMCAWGCQDDRIMKDLRNNGHKI